jgi:hypothetical protein
MAEAGAPVRRLLDAYPWAGTTSRLALLGFDVELRATDADMVALLADLYAPLRVPGPAEHVLSISSTTRDPRRANGPAEIGGRPSAGRGARWEVHLDGVRLILTEAASIAFRHLLFEANRHAIDGTPDLVLVHASAAVLDGRAIVMPGPMGAGKSTLVAALVDAGLGYLTDEVVALDPATGVVVPYPKYISLGPALAHLVPDPRAEIRAILGDQRLVSPDAIRPGALAAAALPRVVVFPRYERGAATAVTRLRPAAALSRLAQHAFHLDHDGPRVLATLATTVERSSCFEMVSGDVDEARDALLALLDGAREPVRS